MKSVIRDVYRLLLRCSANTNPVLPFNATRVVNFCFFFSNLCALHKRSCECFKAVGRKHDTADGARRQSALTKPDAYIVIVRLVKEVIVNLMIIVSCGV